MSINKKISICMMMKDEEKNIDRCLKSLVPIINSGLAELIIVDTGSTDNSIEIAKNYTKQVYEHPWNNNFSDMRNISISYAKGEWIWIIDADEEIENPEQMISFFQKDLSKYNTISIKMKNYMESGKSGKDPSFNISILNRGFRNEEDFNYSGAIHNQPNYKNPTIFSDIIFGHYGYIWEDEEFKQKKYERTAGILKQELEKNPNNIYYQYQLGVSTSIIDNDKGLVEIRKAYELIKKLPYKQRAKYIYVYGMYARTAYKSKEYKEAIKIAKEGLELTKDYIDLWYILSISHADLYQNEEAFKSGKEFIKCKQRFDKTNISKDPALTFYHLDDHSENIIRFFLVNMYIENEDIKTALKQVEKITLSEVKTNSVIHIVKKTTDKKYLLEYMKEAFTQENLKKHLILKLENELSGKQSIILAEDIISFYEKSYIENDDYYYLNVLRDAIHKERGLEEKELEKLLSLDYSQTPVYYGDIIIYIVQNQLGIELFKEIGKTDDIVRMTTYALNKKEDFDKQIEDYLLKNKQIENILNLKYWNVLAKLVLLREKIETKEYTEIFKGYIDRGVVYIQNIYQPNILKEKNIYDLGNDEHRFFLYIMKAYDIKEKNEAEYVRYLRKALKIFPMKKGIEILLKQLQEENQPAEDEMTLLKKKFKDNIRILIDCKKIDEALDLIEQYEEMVQEDVEILLFKSEISLIGSNI